MNDKLLASIKHEVLGWPGVSKETERSGPRMFDSIAYKFGQREIGHIHPSGVADFGFPREIRRSRSDPGEERSLTTRFRTVGQRRAIGYEAQKTCPGPWNSFT